MLFTASCTSELLASCIRRNEEEVESALIELQKRGLTERLTEPGSDVITYRLHSLVFSFTKANCNHLRPLTFIKACKAFLKVHKHDFNVLDVELGNILGGTRAAKQYNKVWFIEMMHLLVVDNAYYITRGHSPQSLILLQQAAIAAKTLQQKEIAHYLFTQLGDTYRELLGDFDLALKSYQEALQLAQQISNQHREAILLSLIGITRFHQQADDANYYLENAYQLAKTHDDGLAICHILQNKGHLASFSNDWQAVRQYSHEAVKVAQKLQINSTVTISALSSKLFFALLNLGEAEHRLGNFDKALTIHLQALEIAQERDNQLWMAYTWQEIGEIYHRIDNRELAQENYSYPEKSFPFFPKEEENRKNYQKSMLFKQ